jgi:hypothetical protein
MKKIKAFYDIHNRIPPSSDGGVGGPVGAMAPPQFLEKNSYEWVVVCFYVFLLVPMLLLRILG